MPTTERLRCDALIVQHLLQSGLIRSATHLASYLACDGEASLDALHVRLQRFRKQLYLPILKPRGNLHFAAYHPDTPLAPNRFGIPEPQGNARLSPRFMNLVLLPLVGFDEHGHRLGMGGGYYDRTFAFVRDARCRQRPRLLGVAYEHQRCRELPVNTWDVPLDGVVTEKGLFLLGAGK